MLGHLTWSGSGEDEDVGNFIERHKNDILIAFRTTRIQNGVNNFYFEMDISFYRRTESSDIQRTTIKFFIPPITSDTVDMNVFQITMMFLEKIEEFTGQNSDWTTFRINYLRLCWGPYRPMMVGSFIPTPRWLTLKHAVVNIRPRRFDDHDSFQYSVLAGINLINCLTRRTKCRSSQYTPFMKMLNMNGTPIPVHPSYIDLFEKQNPEISREPTRHYHHSYVKIR